MSNLFDDLYDIDQETNQDIDLADNISISNFIDWCDKIINTVKISNLISYEIDSVNINYIFENKVDRDNSKFHDIILPLHYITESPCPISSIDINYELDENDKIVLYLIGPVYYSDVDLIEDDPLYHITEQDLESLKILKSKIKIFNVVLNNICFDDLSLYYKFVDIIHDNFEKYPIFSYFTKIKETYKHKKYQFLSSFVEQDKIPKEKLLYDNKIKISYASGRYNIYVKRD